MLNESAHTLVNPQIGNLALKHLVNGRP